MNSFDPISFRKGGARTSANKQRFKAFHHIFDVSRQARHVGGEAGPTQRVCCFADREFCDRVRLVTALGISWTGVWVDRSGAASSPAISASPLRTHTPPRSRPKLVGNHRLSYWVGIGDRDRSSARSRQVLARCFS